MWPGDGAAQDVEEVVDGVGGELKEVGTEASMPGPERVAGRLEQLEARGLGCEPAGSRSRAGGRTWRPCQTLCGTSRSPASPWSSSSSPLLLWVRRRSAGGR